MPNNPATKPTRVAVGSVRAGHSVRLANRAKTSLSPAYVTVTDVEPKDVAEGKPGYRILTADGEYGHFPASAKFELMPEAAIRSEATPKQVKESKGPRVSPSLKNAISKLITAEGERGTMVRSDMHADPMVLIAGERRGWFTVDRTGPERRTDLVTLTEDGFAAAEKMNLVEAGAEAARRLADQQVNDEDTEEEGDTEE